MLEVEKIKDEILGKAYELSFAFIDKKQIHGLNKKYRKKDEPTDTLSFPLSPTSGEILICKEVANLKASSYDLSPKDYLLFLTIHSLLHLRGLEHGAEMEKLEQKYFKKFSNKDL